MAGHGAYEALRGQRTARTVGERPALEEVVEPQGAVTVGCVAAPVPPLAVRLLAGAAGEAVDARTLSFLLSQSVSARRTEEEEKEKEQLEGQGGSSRWERRRRRTMRC